MVCVCVWQEVLEQERERRNELQSQLSNLRATQEGLRSKVTNLEESNAMLLRENEELHSAAVPPGPSYRSVLQDTCTQQ